MPYSDKPRVTVHEQSPFVTPPMISPEQIAQQRIDTEQVVRSASHEAAGREAAFLRAMNKSQAAPQSPRLKAPIVASDFGEQAAALDQAIYSRGVKIPRERLLSLGRKRFQDLLAKDRTARSVQRVLINDYTSWPSVQYGFACTSPLTVNMPRRKMADIASGRFADRDEASKIEGFSDLWKAEQHAPTIRNVLAHHDAFVRLVFGQSLLTRIDNDDRVRSRLFCGGRGRKVALFNDWLSALEGSYVKITIEQPIFSVLAWLCREQTPCADSKELARDWFNVRAPSLAHINVAQAIFEGFLLGKNSWNLWEHVGNTTRAAVEHDHLELWRAELAKRYAAITHFHNALRDFFWRDVSSHQHGHQQFDAAAHRQYVDREIAKLLDCASSLAAQAIEETAQGVLVARFSDWLLCEGEPKTVSTEKISEKLAAAFRGSTFKVAIDEV
jgi:hypothetical protein